MRHLLHFSLFLQCDPLSLPTLMAVPTLSDEHALSPCASDHPRIDEHLYDPYLPCLSLLSPQHCSGRPVGHRPRAIHVRLGCLARWRGKIGGRLGCLARRSTICDQLGCLARWRGQILGPTRLPGAAARRGCPARPDPGSAWLVPTTGLHAPSVQPRVHPA
jgi:hypothetical protein